MKLFDLSGRTAVVVGGTSGIGRDAGARAGRRGRGRRRHRPPRGSRRGRSPHEIETARPAHAAPSPLTSATSASLERLRDACLEAFGAHRHPAVRGRHDEARADARDGRGRLAPRSSRPTSPARFARARCSAAPMVDAALRPHHHHRVAVVVRRAVRGGGLHGEQGRRRRADARAGGRVGAAQRDRQRDRPGRLPDRSQRARCSIRRAARSS